MTAFVHRQGDSRSCGASTVTKIANVRVNNLAISTDGDTNTHGGGGLIAGQTVGSVRAGGIPVILNGDMLILMHYVLYQAELIVLQKPVVQVQMYVQEVINEL